MVCYQDNEQVKAQLERLRERVGLLAFATIAGSHSWCMNAPDSDIDIRCIYFMPPRDYALASLHKDYPKTYEWVEDGVDIAGYEVGFVVSKMLAGNTGFLEMFRGWSFLPEIPALEKVLNAIADVQNDPVQTYRHYVGWAIGNYNRYIVNRSEIHESRYYHIVKGVICAELVRNGISHFPIDLLAYFSSCREMLQCTNEEYEAIYDLLQRKRAGPLKTTERNSLIDDYIVRVSQSKLMPECLSDFHKEMRNDRIAVVKDLYAEMIISYLGEFK